MGKTTEKKVQSAAILTIKDSADMTTQGKKDIAEWFRRQAKMLVKEGHNYSGRFTARYLYVEGDK